MFSRLDVFRRFGDEDTFALATCIWLTDVCLAFFGPSIGLEVTVTAKHSQIRSESSEISTEKNYIKHSNQVQTDSAGRHQVLGKTLYSLGKSFSMRFKFLASRSLRQISLIPGKWFIFCKEKCV